MSEKRKLKRRHLLYYARIFDAQTHALLGNLVDITPEGVMLVSDKPLPTGKPFRLSVELSEDIANRQFLELEATSVWCQPDVDPSFFATGFELSTLAAPEHEIIQRIIENYGFRDN
jgi:hypothetical protein